MDDYYLIVAYILAGLLGVCVGSFLNVVIYRLPENMSLSKPNSHCPKCNYELKFYDNIPLLSYIFLGGKCRNCKEKISPRYFIVELLNCLLWILSVAIFWKTSIPYTIIACIVSSLFICVFAIDLDHMIIFDRFNILIGLLGVASIFFDNVYPWYDHLIGFGVAGGAFLLIYLGAILILKKEGMGFGDVKLAFAVGLLLGWQKFLFAILFGSVVGSIVLTLLRAKNKEEGKEYPFAPFIVLGCFVAMFFGDFIINWYLTLILG